MADGTPLRKMLHVLADGGIHATVEVARRIGVSQGLVAAMVEDLARQGYLIPLESDCGTTCSGCWAAGSCDRPDTASTMLALSPKGRQAVHGLR
jgi:hypothetical protein